MKRQRKPRRFQFQSEAQAQNQFSNHFNFEKQPDVLDYMSDQFLSVSSGEAENTARKKAKSETERGPAKTLPLKQRMEQQRAEGMQKQIGQDNVGFRLLSKMGFKKGQGLGKAKQGIVAPVGVDIKKGRGGLGKEMLEKQRLEALALRRRHMATQRIDDFSHNQRTQYQERQSKVHLTTARKMIETLDTKAGRPRSYLWPENENSDDDEPAVNVGDAIFECELDKHYQDPIYRPENDEEKEIESFADETGQSIGMSRSEVSQMFEEYAQLCPSGNSDLTSSSPWSHCDTITKLSYATDYLRREYHYCIYCGCQYNDEKDLETNCPGKADDDH
mmetsp:Transcript_38504/g.49722  ORF Transcript_38504/g.49722 Transcript_38504/m.49722 type:complete len:332 (+) Transcript_38504:26-1021(+)